MHHVTGRHAPRRWHWGGGVVAPPTPARARGRGRGLRAPRVGVGQPPPASGRAARGDACHLRVLVLALARCPGRPRFLQAEAETRSCLEGGTEGHDSLHGCCPRTGSAGSSAAKAEGVLHWQR